MGFKKISTVILLSLVLLFVLSIPTLAIPNSELPWTWIQIASNEKDLFFGFGTRDPNLGENFGLQVAATYKDDKISPNLDLLYFFDTSDNCSFNIGIGAFAENNTDKTTYKTTYSGGIWYHFGDVVAGIGYHSQQGLTLRAVLNF